MPRPRAGRGDKCLRDTLIFIERTSEESCKITLPVILQLSLSSVIFLSYLRKMGARSGRSASAGFAALQLICRRRILGKKEGRIDPVIRGVLV